MHFYVYVSFQHFYAAFLSFAVNHKHAIHLHAVCQPPFEKPCHVPVGLQCNENQCNTDDTSNYVFLESGLINHSLALSFLSNLIPAPIHEDLWAVSLKEHFQHWNNYHKIFRF